MGTRRRTRARPTVPNSSEQFRQLASRLGCLGKIGIDGKGTFERIARRSELFLTNVGGPKVKQVRRVVGGPTGRILQWWNCRYGRALLNVDPANDVTHRRILTEAPLGIKREGQCLLQLPALLGIEACQPERHPRRARSGGDKLFVLGNRVGGSAHLLEEEAERGASF